WDEPRACEQDATGWHRVVAQEPLDELPEAPPHARRRGLAGEERLAVRAEDAHRDRERRVPVVGHMEGRAERAGAGVDLRLGEVERVRALDGARRDVVADREGGEDAV